jgi:hypothetical protein
VRLADQWNTVLERLDPSWGEAHLAVTIRDENSRNRAAALLAPASPRRVGSSLRFDAARRGGAIGPEAVRRMLRRLDEERIGGVLTLVDSVDAPPAPEVVRPSLAAGWEAALATLPSDWTDLLCELELTSSDHIDRAALLTAPLNPIQTTHIVGFRFRCASHFGYGASPAMVGRCLARLDEDDIPGGVRILRALSDTHPVGTQGPVWYLDGKPV